MKKNRFFTTLLISSMLVSFTGCFNPIFSEIRKDVAPETATVSGNITSITRYTAGGQEYLVLNADEGLKYKLTSNEEHDSWNIFTALPFELSHFNYSNSTYEGQQIIKVLADSENLYLFCVKYEATGWEGKTNPSAFCLWSSKISAENGIWNPNSEWTSMNVSAHNYFPLEQNSNDYYYSNFNFFQTNAPIAANRHAYLCTYDEASKKCSYYELAGLDSIVEIIIPENEVEDYSLARGNDDAYDDDTDIPYNRVYSAVYFDGRVRFFHSVASTTDETYSTQASHIYFGNYETLYYKSLNDSTYTSVADETKSRYIAALATCKDSLLIGCGEFATGTGSGGIKRVILSEGIPQGKIIDDFDSNAKTQLSTSYFISALINATPDRTEAASALYAALTYADTNGVFANIGLWSYYPERGNWNRE